jgi:hypothetical protein
MITNPGFLILLLPYLSGMFSYLLLTVSLSKEKSHWFNVYSAQKIWGDLKLLLLGTDFWALKAKRPQEYSAKHRKKQNLTKYDYVIMPMYEGG